MVALLSFADSVLSISNRLLLFSWSPCLFCT